MEHRGEDISFPSASHWAGIFRPFRAEEMRVQIRRSALREIKSPIKGVPTKKSGVSFNPGYPASDKII
jgi:hypothetical protein